MQLKKIQESKKSVDTEINVTKASPQKITADDWLPDFDNPDDLTPEERLSHIAKILAIGSTRLFEAETRETSNSFDNIS